MELSWLIERIKNPKKVQAGDERQLREFILKYPYFSYPYLLLGKALKVQEHPAFDELLPLIALHAHNRGLLFDLVHEVEAEASHRRLSEVEGTETDANLVKVEVEAEVEASHRRLSEVEGTETDANLVKVEVEAEEIVEEGQRDISIGRFSIDFNEVEKEEETETFVSDASIPEIPFGLGDELDEDLLESQEEVESDEPVDLVPEFSSVLGDEMEEDFLESQEVAELVEPVDLTPELSSVLGDEIAEEREPEVVTDKEPLPKEESQKNEFTAWLEKLQPLSEVGKVEPTKKPSESLADTLEKSLIDKFIATNPSVSRVKETFFNPEAKARESERLDDSLITETLAGIYAKQGKFERAIEAYQKLQLKFPDKSNYFAALIEEIKLKANN